MRHQGAPTVEVVHLPPLELRAELAPDSVDEERRTVDLTFSTGVPVTRVDFWTGKPAYVEVLSLKREHVRLDRLNAGAPLLDAHHAFSVRDIIGTVVPGTARLEAGGPGGGVKAKATVQFSRRAEVEPVWQDVRSGIIRNVSVGYRVHRFEETVGSDGKLPVRTAIDWEPFEVSLVPMGADPGAKIRSGELLPLHPCELIKHQEETMDKAEQEKAQEAPQAPAKRAESRPETGGIAKAELEAAAKAERERVEEIRRIVRAAGLEERLAIQMIEDGTPLPDARRVVLEALEKRSMATPTLQTTRIDAGESEAEKWRRGAQAWLYQKAAVADLIRQAAAKRPDHPVFKDVVYDPGQFRGMSLLDLARDSLERSGIRTRGLDKMRVAELVLRAGEQTTSDFTVALENVLHKTLLAAYTIAPDDWRRFCAIGSVTDFRAHPRYRTGFLGRLDVVREAGEFANKALPDAVKESITAQTRGNIIALSRQAIINDDMSVFSRVAAQLGRAAALSIELDVFDLLKQNSGLGPTMGDGLTLFHANHNNIGTAAAISVDALDADRVVMASQKDPAGNEVLNVRPAILVVPSGLGGQARVINDAQYDFDATSKFQKPNKVRGLFREIVDTPQLTGTRRYLFADPAIMPVIEVAFLEGQQEPFLQAQEGWRIDGVEWKVRLDYGVAAIEFRGAVTNAGA